MRKQTYIYGILVLILIEIATASLGTYRQGDCVNIRTILNTTSVNISTISYPNSSIAVSNVEMTQNGQTFTYNFCETGQTGTYIYDYFDNEGNTYVNDFEIKQRGDEQDNNFTETAFFIGLAILVALFMILKISKIFGSMMIMTIGLGVLFKVPQNGWIGWIIVACGLLMTLYALMTPSRPRKRYRR